MQLNASSINSNFCLLGGPGDLHPAIRTRAKRHDLQNVRTVNSPPQGLLDSSADSRKEPEGTDISKFTTSRGMSVSSHHILEIGDKSDNTCPPKSASSQHIAPVDLDLNASYPGEMIDDGMEWLQSLFANGLDADLLPVWD